MGRVAEKNAYQKKSAPIVVNRGNDGGLTRGQRSLSDTGGPKDFKSPVLSVQGSPFQIPMTPSPWIHADPDPRMMEGFTLEIIQPGSASHCMAFGDFGAVEVDGVVDGSQQEYTLGEAGNFDGMQYDPNTGTYMVYDYSNCYVPYDPNCYGMMNQDEMQDGMNQMDAGQMQDGGNPDEHTKVLLAALGEKIGENQVDLCGESTFEPNGIVPLNGNAEEFVVSGAMEGWGGEGQQGQECWDGSAWGQNSWDCGIEDQQQNGADSLQPQQPASQRRAERREARVAARRGENSERAAAAEARGAGQDDGQSKWNTEVPQNGSGGLPGNITTVMLRNIPNKYTREMLVKQLEQDMRGQFDFIYLPIDFKNQCNVGYAFINFFTFEACDTFVSRYNGVEVRKCLPGLNSRKITEVTPARVQGFEDNVQRLRNSPVMRELVHKPEWMPLIFDADGNNLTFPQPERPLEAIMPRRRARYEQD